MEIILLALVGVCLFGFGFSTLSTRSRTLKVRDLVDSTETDKLSEIPNKVGEMVELHCELIGKTLISPISKTPCLMYKVEVMQGSIGSGLTSQRAITEEERVEDTYLKEGNLIADVDLNKFKKVYMRPFIWSYLELKQRDIVKEYLSRDHVKVDSFFGLEPLTGAVVVKESVIPANEKVYVLGKVRWKPRPHGEYIENEYEDLEYTVDGHLDCHSEEHFKSFLRTKSITELYFTITFFLISITIFYGLYVKFL